MAYDKVVDSAVLETGLTLIGDSIRAKSGTSAKLEFPNGMKAAVDAIDTSEDLSAELAEYTILNAELEEVIDSLPDAGSSGGGSGGGSLDTCTVTITQEWGMNDDPLLLTLYTPYYNILANGSVEYGSVEFSSGDDYEPSHSVTFTALKNIPIMILAKGFSNIIKCTVTGQGGTIEELEWTYSLPSDLVFYRCIPTADTAVFTVATP